MLIRNALALLAILAISIGPAAAVPAQTINCSTADQQLPGGEVATNDEDPLIPVYCLPDAPVHAPTRVSGANDWVDDFKGINGQARLNDGDMGYRIFDMGGIGATKHMIVGDHWIDDNQLRYAGGVAMRPDRTFVAENNKIVVEADVSAGKAAYRGNAWPEFVIVAADPDPAKGHPDVNPPDAPEQNYAYGHFKGYPTFGCRLQDGGTFTCAAFTGTTLGNTPNTADRAPCFSLGPDRLWELSYFQGCGNYFPNGVHYGGDRFGGRDKYFRVCDTDEMYDDCMDRIRLELTPTSMVWYVNGQRFFEDSGWDTLHQLGPANIPNGLFTRPFYVYFADFNFIDDTQKSFRFHWERLAVNPHNPDGTFMAPSASEDWLAAQGPQPTPQPTATRTATVAPTATRTPLPASTATSTAMPTQTAMPTATATQPPAATVTPAPVVCEVNVRIDGVERGWKPC